MTAKKVDLTPKLAAEYLSNLFHRQRKLSRNTVALYERVMQDGGWADYNPDSPIMRDRSTLAMFNGRQRCTAVVNSGITIKVLVDDDLDAEAYFDYVDIGLGRAAHQFIIGSHASVRASAARVILWHEQAFDIPLSRLASRWQLHEIRAKADDLNDEYEQWLPFIDGLYQSIHLSQSVMVAALVIAARRGHTDEAMDFVTRVAEPAGLDPLDPAYILVRRMNSTIHFKRRRQPQQDWLLFVRALNAAINDEALPGSLHSSASIWPDVGDTEAMFRRRIGRLANAKSNATKIERRIRAQVEAEMNERSGGSMAASSANRP
jgi:hypothetical protein